MSMLELNSWTFSEEQDFVFVAVRGEDAENFLQGMLTQNVKTMGPTDARWTAACNHQGRTAATSLIVRIPNGFGMLMPKSIAQDEVEQVHFEKQSRNRNSSRTDHLFLLRRRQSY